MDRQINMKIAEETMRITKQGWYEKNGRKIELPNVDYSRVIVIDPLEGDSFEDLVITNIDDINGKIYIVEADSFAAADGMEKCLVMNFANAHTPGGGFLHGANAQEECLCRQSTLYGSISNNIAAEMYQYNKEHNEDCYSDYMLLSPNVCVFRDWQGELLDEPYLVSVITVPAPNRNGAARYAKQSVIDTVMKDRLSKMFAIACEYGYKSLVLGAWGCGAFGHNPHKVARYFYECLIGYAYATHFDMITFAIIDRKNKPNLLAFSDVFKNNAELCFDLPQWPLSNATHEQQANFYQANFPPIEFNFSISNISKENIGYAYGVISNGCPFMAELWKYGSNEDVAFYLPVNEDFMKLEGEPHINKETGTKTFAYNKEVKGFHALCVGMINNGFVDDLSVQDAYISFLCEHNLLDFAGQTRNSYAFLLTDSAGNDLIAITVSLIDEGEIIASTPLIWKQFPHHKKKRHLRVVSPSTDINR